MYGHFPLVAGILLTALGVEGVVAHAGEGRPLGVFYALSPFGGAALYLAGHLVFQRRMHRTLSLPRVATGVLLAAAPAAVLLPPMAGLVGLVAILTVLIIVETTRYGRRPTPSAEQDRATIREERSIRYGLLTD